MNKLGKRLMAKGQALRNDERGAIEIAGLMMMGIGMIFLAVGFIIYPIIMDATDSILAWSANVSGNAYTIADFTGLSNIVGIVPLVTLLGFVTAGAITGFMGIKMVKGEGGGGGSINPGSLMVLGIGLIFIAVALIIYPVVLDGVSTALDASIVAGTYTGLTPILRVTPLIVITAFLTGGIVAGFFGIKGMKKSAGV